MLGQMADGNASVQNPASDRNRIKMADRYRQIFRCRHRSDRLRSRILGFGNKKTVETACGDMGNSTEIANQKRMLDDELGFVYFFFGKDDKSFDDIMLHMERS